MTRGIIIRDGTDPGDSLDFDLAEILGALGDRAVQSRWRCSDLEYTARGERNVDVLERASKPGESVTGTELTKGIDQLIQVIDGEFEGLGDGDQRWVLVRAVDSSWWEVWSEDETVLDTIRAKFKRTEVVTRDGTE